MARFHIEGLFAFDNVNDLSGWVIAGRAWLHIHTSERASLSIGGGGGVQSIENEPMVGRPSSSTSNLLLEGGAQIRFFATRNVALVRWARHRGRGWRLDRATGQVTGALGITYFLF